METKDLQEALKDALVLIQELSDKVSDLETKVKVLNTLLDVHRRGIPPYAPGTPLVSRRLDAIEETLDCAAKNREVMAVEIRKNEIRAKAVARFNYLIEHPNSVMVNGTYEDYKKELDRASHQMHWGY